MRSTAQEGPAWTEATASFLRCTPTSILDCLARVIKWLLLYPGRHTTKSNESSTACVPVFCLCCRQRCCKASAIANPYSDTRTGFSFSASDADEVTIVYKGCPRALGSMGAALASCPSLHSGHDTSPHLRYHPPSAVRRFSLGPKTLHAVELPIDR